MYNKCSYKLNINRIENFKSLPLQWQSKIFHFHEFLEKLTKLKTMTPRPLVNLNTLFRNLGFAPLLPHQLTKDDHEYKIIL